MFPTSVHCLYTSYDLGSCWRSVLPSSKLCRRAIYKHDKRNGSLPVKFSLRASPERCNALRVNAYLITGKSYIRIIKEKQFLKKKDFEEKKTEIHHLIFMIISKKSFTRKLSVYRLCSIDIKVMKYSYTADETTWLFQFESIQIIDVFISFSFSFFANLLQFINFYDGCNRFHLNDTTINVSRH